MKRSFLFVSLTLSHLWLFLGEKWKLLTPFNNYSLKNLSLSSHLEEHFLAQGVAFLSFLQFCIIY